MSSLFVADPSARRRWIVLTGATSFLLWRCWMLYLAARLPFSAAVDMVFDDAYYYLQIAYNMAARGRSSFDGITSTNGYQPAWMALIAGLECALRLDKKGLFVALQALMLVVMAWPLIYCLRRARDPFFLAAAGGLTASYAAFPGIYTAGMETVLFAPAFVALLCATRAGLAEGAGKAAWLFAPIVMIRLDALSLVIAYALVLAYLTWRDEGLALALRRGLQLCAPACTTLALYALGSYFLFDSPVPLSGVAKAVGAVPFSNWGVLYNYVLEGIPTLLAALVLIPIELVWTKFEGGQFHYAAIGMLALSLVFQYGYYATCSGWMLWPWYFYGSALMIALLVARAIDIAARVAAPEWTGGKMPGVLALSLTLTALWLTPFGTHTLLTRQLLENEKREGRPTGSFNRRSAADVLDFERDKAQMVVAIGDRAAGLGYWSPENVKVFALEGLVSDKAYLDARKHDQGERWVREQINPRYLIVDREQLEPVRLGAEQQYVVIEPIQGRVVMDHVIAFCFPKQALVRMERGRDDQLLVLPAPAVRATFDFRMGERCRGPFAEYAQRQILGTESLRKQAVGVEYAPFMGGELNEALERFDRRLALRVRSFMHL